MTHTPPYSVLCYNNNGQWPTHLLTVFFVTITMDNDPHTSLQCSLLQCDFERRSNRRTAPSSPHERKLKGSFVKVSICITQFHTLEHCTMQDNISRKHSHWYKMLQLVFRIPQNHRYNRMHAQTLNPVKIWTLIKWPARFAHGLYASACKISPSYDTVFRRR